jgi:NTE family protein
VSRVGTIGIALSGGGTRGFAHLGMLSGLLEAGVSGDLYAGTSIGAITGAFMADGHHPDDIYKLFKDKAFFNFVRPAFKFGGLLNLDGMAQMLRTHLNAQTFEELEKPLKITVTDYMAGTLDVLNSGPLVAALMASAAVPLVFEPIKLHDKYYIDGGVLGNLPAGTIRKDCDFLIGCDLVPIPVLDKKPTQIGFADRILSLSVSNSTREDKALCDLIISPDSIHQYRFFDTSVAAKLYKAGREEVLRHQEQIHFLQRNG